MHPVPVRGEALSSWLRRIASVYCCTVADLLRYDLGFPEAKPSLLDFEAPSDLIEVIAVRSGMSFRTIEKTTFAGSLPFLSGRVFTDPSKDDVETCSVLFEPPNPAPGSYEKLRNWFQKESKSKLIGCRHCLADYKNGATLLGWGLKVVLSCPVHEVMIEPGRKEGDRIEWRKDREEPALKQVCNLDERSLEAVSEGSVQLPGGLVSAVEWFRILQAIFHELNAPWLSVESGRFVWQLKLWEAAGYHSPGPFETFKFDRSCALLIATAIDHMETGAVRPTGTYGKFFVKQSERERFRSADLNSVRK